MKHFYLITILCAGCAGVSTLAEYSWLRSQASNVKSVASDAEWRISNARKGLVQSFQRAKELTDQVAKQILKADSSGIDLAVVRADSALNASAGLALQQVDTFVQEASYSVAELSAEYPSLKAHIGDIQGSFLLAKVGANPGEDARVLENRHEKAWQSFMILLHEIGEFEDHFEDMDDVMTIRSTWSKVYRAAEACKRVSSIYAVLGTMKDVQERVKERIRDKGR